MIQTTLNDWKSIKSEELLNIIDEEITQKYEVAVLDDGRVALAVFWYCSDNYNGTIDSSYDISSDELFDVEQRVNFFDDSDEADEIVREVLELGRDFGTGCYSDDSGYICVIIGN